MDHLSVINRCKTKNTPKKILAFVNTFNKPTKLLIYKHFYNINVYKKLIYTLDTLSRKNTNQLLNKLSVYTKNMWVVKSNNSVIITNKIPKHTHNLKLI